MENLKQAGKGVAKGVTGLVTGLVTGFMGFGRNIVAGQHKPTLEAFCAHAGRVAAQNGELKPEEIESFNQFLTENQGNPIFGALSKKDTAKLFEDYAMKAFRGERNEFFEVLKPINPASDEAKLIVSGCLAIAFADGDCDPDERRCIEEAAKELAVNTADLAEELGLELPA